MFIFLVYCVGSNDVRCNIICICYFSFGVDRNKMILFLFVIRKIERNYNYISMKNSEKWWENLVKIMGILNLGFFLRWDLIIIVIVMVNDVLISYIWDR